MTVAGKPHEVMTTGQAAEYLQVSEEAIVQYITDGRILAAKLERGYRIPRRQLDVLLWAARDRTDIELRSYSADAIAGFLRDDEPDEVAASIMKRIHQRHDLASPG